MRFTLLLLALISTGVGATGKDHHNKNKHHHKHHHKDHKHDNKLDAVALNSPVKSGELRIQLDPPKKFKIESVLYFLADSTGKPLLKPNTWKTATLVSSGNKPVAQIPVNLNSPGRFKAHLKAVSKKHGNRVTKVSFEVIKENIVVVDPSEEGRKNLAGIDRDLNGVRDDVQVFINTKFPLDKYPSINQGLMQLSKSDQQELLSYPDRDKVHAAAEEGSKALECLTWIVGVDRVMSLIRVHESIFLNTEDRITTHLRNQKLLHGYSLPDEIVETKLDELGKFCSFVPQKEIFGQ